jgi:hypothetical protein
MSGNVSDLHYKFRETVQFSKVKAIHIYLEEGNLGICAIRINKMHFIS